MEKDEIIERLRKILVEVLGHENFELRDDVTAKEIANWNSLAHMEIISKIEDAFNIKFKLKELNKLQNIKNLVEIILVKM